MSDIIDLQFSLLAEEFGKSEKSASVDKSDPVPGAPSMFNPFNLFRYSKYGLNPNQYRSNLHFDAGSDGLTKDDAAALMGVSVDPFVPTNQQNTSNQTGDSNRSSTILSQIQPFTDQRRVIENPDAASIINWAQLEATPGARTAKGATPYAVSDFLYCTYYGKVPNNRMVTLRRYPIPIEDNLAISANKTPLVPLAQAVTWYGEDVGNKLSDVINLSWGFNWESISSKVDDIYGNELTVEDLIAAIPGIKDPAVIQVLKTQIFSGGGKIDILKLSGWDVNAQEYIKNAYTDKGPYWNRVLGPVNVIDSTYVRSRGFVDNKTNPIKLQFKYSLRSYNGLNPKLVFLDLYTNFLSLTYNSAPFWGGGARYFQQTGVTIPQLRMEQQIFDGKFADGIQDGAKELANLASARLNELIGAAQSAVKQLGGSTKILGSDGKIRYDQLNELAKIINPVKEGVDAQIDKQISLNPIDKALLPRLGKLLRKPLLFRSILDGRAVGEWHITVGNPMNPMAMIGNLVLDRVDCDFSETLGLDDFPTEVTFTVTLKHGRPRAKQDIESIFNLGNGAMSFSELPDPSSASNSYGEYNKIKSEAAIEGISIEQAQAGVESSIDEISIDLKDPGQPDNQVKVSADVDVRRSSIGDLDRPRTKQEIKNLTDAYRSQVRRLYGSVYGDSNILTDYFTDLKTKD